MRYFIVLFSILYLGCGGGSGSNSATISGVVSDGYIKNAVVCLDLNNNFLCDSNEPSTKSDEFGVYNLIVSTDLAGNDANVIATGGYNVITQKNNDLLIAPRESYDMHVNITPITTFGYFLSKKSYLKLQTTNIDIQNLFKLNIDAFEDPQKDFSLLKYSVFIDGLYKILKSFGYSYDGAYNAIVNYLEYGDEYLTSDVYTNYLINYIKKTIDNLNQNSELSNSDFEKGFSRYTIDRIINSDSVYIPILKKYNVIWYKLLSQYKNDYRYKYSFVEAGEFINLTTYKEDLSQTRASIASWGFGGAINVTNTIRINELGDYRKFVLFIASEKIYSSYSLIDNLNSKYDLGIYAGITIYEDKVIFWGGVSDMDGHNYTKEFGSKEVDDDFEGKIVKARIRISGDDVIYYLYDDEGDVIYTKSVDFEDKFYLNENRFYFTYTKSRVQISDDEAYLEGKKAGDEANVDILDVDIY